MKSSVKRLFSARAEKKKEEPLQGFRYRTEFPREKVKSFWKIGQSLAGGSSHSSRSIAAQKSLALSERRASEIFYRLYRNRKPWQSNLAWEHFEVLIQIQDSDERSFYEHEAVRHGWTPAKLKKAVADRVFSVRHGVGESMILADAGRRGKAVGSLHNHVQVASQLLS